jgi:hypothetical protein
MGRRRFSLVLYCPAKADLTGGPEKERWRANRQSCSLDRGFCEVDAPVGNDWHAESLRVVPESRINHPATDKGGEHATRAKGGCSRVRSTVR